MGETRIDQDVGELVVVQNPDLSDIMEFFRFIPPESRTGPSILGYTALLRNEDAKPQIDVSTDDDEDSLEWRDKAECRGTHPDVFFPNEGAGTGEAIRICQGCEVKTDCLEYALVNKEEHGVWGGASERERRRILRRRRQARN